MNTERDPKSLTGVLIHIAKKTEAEQDEVARSRELARGVAWAAKLVSTGEKTGTIGQVVRKLKPAGARDGVLAPDRAESIIRAAWAKVFTGEEPLDELKSEPAKPALDTTTTADAERLLAALAHPLVAAKVKSLAFDACASALLAAPEDRR